MVGSVRSPLCGFTSFSLSRLANSEHRNNSRQTQETRNTMSYGTRKPYILIASASFNSSYFPSVRHCPVPDVENPAILLHTGCVPNLPSVP